MSGEAPDPIAAVEDGRTWTVPQEDAGMENEIARPVRAKRIQSVDTLRGFTIGLMIFVNHAGYYPPWLPHTSWNGIHVADFVMPCFLFVVGVSIAISIIPKMHCMPPTAIVSKVLSRTGKLFALGLIIQGGVATGRFPSYNLAVLRYMGVLQRIALCFFITAFIAMVAVRKGPRASKCVLIGLSILTAVWFTGYTALTLLATVPSCPEVRPPNTPACNLAEYVDAQIMGINHMYPYPTCHKAQPPCLAFDPEGLFATVGGATVSTLLGLLAGYVLLLYESHHARLVAWLVPSGLLCVLGLAAHLSGAIPLNKNLYSSSYVMLTGGTSLLLLSMVYLLHDAWAIHIYDVMAQPCTWLGMNSIVVYAGDEIGEQMLGWIYYQAPSQNLHAVIAALIQQLTGENSPGKDLAIATADVIFWVLVARHLFKAGKFYRI